MLQKHKKIMLIIAAVMVLSLSLCACGNDKSQNGEPSQSAQNEITNSVKTAVGKEFSYDTKVETSSMGQRIDVTVSTEKMTGKDGSALQDLCEGDFQKEISQKIQTIESDLASDGVEEPSVTVVISFVGAEDMLIAAAKYTADGLEDIKMMTEEEDQQ